MFIVTGGVTTDIDIASAVNDYVGSVGTCPLGSTILGFYLETSTSNVDDTISRIDWMLIKRPGARSIANYPVPGASGGHNLRKQIFHESKGIGGTNLFDNGASTLGGSQTTRMREFIRIPKGFRRMGENDIWTIRVGSSENYSFCLKCIYKWYQ